MIKKLIIILMLIISIFLLNSCFNNKTTEDNTVLNESDIVNEEGTENVNKVVKLINKIEVKDSTGFILKNFDNLIDVELEGDQMIFVTFMLQDESSEMKKEITYKLGNTVFKLKQDNMFKVSDDSIDLNISL